MRIHFDVTAHGFGHLAMCSEIIHRLLEHPSRYRVSLGIDYNKKILLQFFNETQLSNLAITKGPFDPAVSVDGPLRVDFLKTKKIYQDAMNNVDTIFKAEQSRLNEVKPDILVSNISPWCLAAMAKSDVKKFALSSLDRANQLSLMNLQEEANFVLELYQHAEAFFCLTPHADLLGMPNPTVLSPIGRLGRNKRHKLNSLLESRNLALVTFGGIGNLNPWDLIQSNANSTDWYFITPEILGEFGISHIDCIATVDVLITKPGYGTYVEALLHRKPCVTWPRKSWLEATNLNAYMNAHNAIILRDETVPLKIQLQQALEMKIEPTNNNGANEFIEILNLQY